ncbi:hypothetical protein [Streptomyces sp. NRRL WC-3742]|uniref:hypothetical protein n=1 Tax=Streptomyces sp. NRRL WC-3742 TaxID=1463934 RepID=UPI0004CBBB69|nr:hypothetical protein [Streptomyces sp. NRRL WC-3742]
MPVPPPTAPPPERTTYLVTYAVRGEAGVRHARVELLPGYAQESDVPRLLAARLTGRVGDAGLITVLELREELREE